MKQSSRHPGTRTIAAITGARSEYGIYRPVFDEMTRDSSLALRLIACGSHLVPEFGRTEIDIERDGFHISDRVDTWSGDSQAGIAAAISKGIAGFSKLFAADRPDMLLLLGDRHDALAGAIAALPFAIPVAHIHGGELTEGLIDEAIRHSLTKMAHVHFVAADVYRDRVVQMGEAPERVFVSGGPGLDAIRTTPPTSRKRLEDRIGLCLSPDPILVTFHPVTLEAADTPRQMGILTEVLAEIDRPILFTYPNADTASGDVVSAIDRFVASNSKSRVVKNLGSADYFGMLRISGAMIGNSSSGIIEAPSFRLPVVNIGDRQRGRLRAANVIDCPPEPAAIRSALARATDPAFRTRLEGMTNPYGDGHAAGRISSILRSIELGPELIKKRFHDLPS